NNGFPQEFQIIVVLHVTERRSPVAGDGGIGFAHATKREQLKSIEAGKGLQLDEARDESILHGANSKIHDQKRRMCRFIRDLQAGWNRSRRMSREFRSAGLSRSEERRVGKECRCRWWTEK